MPDFTTKQLRGSAAVDALTTELNALANNSLALGSALSLSAAQGAGYVLAEVELAVTFSSAPGANTAFAVWFLREIDGTNYEDGSGSVTPARAPDCVLPLRAVTTAQRVIVVALIPAGGFKTLGKNDGTGVAFPASGSTLKLRALTYEAEQQA